MKKFILISAYLALSLVVHAEKKYITDGFGIWSTESFKKFTPELKCTNPVLGAGSIKTIQTVDIYDRFILYEKNNRFLCQCSKYRKDGRLEYFLKIMSLSTGKELFFTESNYLREVFAEDGKVYLPVQNKLFTANYTDENISLNEVKNFVPKKEKIIVLRKNYDIYVLRTEYWRFNPVRRFIFGIDSQIWNYYVCKNYHTFRNRSRSTWTERVPCIYKE